ncbi:uncharacterized protein STEHIDRAFT_147869 [Stereum hirsutum FP-91666 SS1]|uniref:uncharacterized protein n=1 Tax=Stereum hirsutum (strain FP-91666) TaxID=721885 RepID=UPI000444A407|nr:uncharacterized protein STEHIDRAFT_147869 [Stereum hirsutum FP-91666 SS1]EIM85483.1 hypothetical protein STEHIDRAFT_147869 [Stereum hirsutum FP-91666 SS1]
MMFFGNTPRDPAVAEKNAHSITFYLRRNQPPPMMPMELSGHVSPDSWASRLFTLNRMCAQYHRPIFEAIWLIMGVIASIAVPAVAYRLIFNSLRDPDDIFNRREEGPFFQARVASLGVFVGVCLIFFVPLFLWKRIGQKRVDSMVRRWGHDDVRVKGQGEFIPVWKVNMPGVFSTQAELILSLPASHPSNFHPAAYLPSWINAPIDEKAPAYYQSNAASTFPLNGPNGMAVNDGIPLYLDDKAPAYYRADEKV